MRIGVCTTPKVRLLPAVVVWVTLANDQGALDLRARAPTLTGCTSTIASQHAARGRSQDRPTILWWLDATIARARLIRCVVHACQPTSVTEPAVRKRVTRRDRNVRPPTSLDDRRSLPLCTLRSGRFAACLGRLAFSGSALLEPANVATAVLLQTAVVRYRGGKVPFLIIDFASAPQGFCFRPPGFGFRPSKEPERPPLGTDRPRVSPDHHTQSPPQAASPAQSQVSGAQSCGGSKQRCLGPTKSVV